MRETTVQDTPAIAPATKLYANGKATHGNNTCEPSERDETKGTEADVFFDQWPWFAWVVVERERERGKNGRAANR
jgi:hypothetical protein